MEQYKRFVLTCVSWSALIMGLLVFINLSIDLYGLFWRDGKAGISIYSDERTSKYLLAHKYVPLNFDAYILGPSLSANLNTKEILEYKIYNLSMMGANITEQREVLSKAMERSIPKFVIICLHPYLTADHGMKTGMINSREYYGALGSVSLYKAYTLKIIRNFDLMPTKYPRNQFNDYGYNNYTNLLNKMPVNEKIEEQLQRDDAIDASVDSIAWKEFGSLVNDLVKLDSKIIAYFHPLPYPLYKKFEEPLSKYKSKANEELEDKAVLIDFNSQEYDFFTKNFSNYIDHGHLSEKGQLFLMKEIIKKSKFVIN